MHPTIQKIADHFGVVLSERSCSAFFPLNFPDHDALDRDVQQEYVFDGTTTATKGLHGPMTDHDILHEIMHYAVAAPEQRDLPEYGLGTAFFNGSSYVVDVVDSDEAQVQEVMVQYLCIRWGSTLGVSSKLSAEEGNWDGDVSWAAYLDYKSAEHQDQQDTAWKALIRLDQSGLLNVPASVY